MTGQGLLQLALYLVVLVLLVKPLGAYMATVFQGERTFMSPLLGPVERLIYRVSGVDPAQRIGLEALRVRRPAGEPPGLRRRVRACSACRACCR